MSATLTKVRPRECEKELWRRLGRDRDQRAREELVDIYMPTARRMAGRYAGVIEPSDDLVQVTSLALLNAIDRFDIDRGTPFAGFAKPTIMGELKRYFRDKVWTIRAPRSLHDRMAAIETATEDLTDQLDRERKVLRLRFVEDLPQSEIAALIGCSQMHVSRLLRGTLDRLREAATESREAG